MEAIGKTVADHWELFGAMWGGVVLVVSGVASWTAAKSGAKYAMILHEEKIKEHTARLDALESCAKLAIMESKCEKLRQSCQGDIEEDECGVTKKIDNLTAKIEDLEKRRSSRWEEFERRREASKDSLQKTFEKFAGKITRLETIINERSNRFRNNGSTRDIMLEIPCMFDDEDGSQGSGFSNAVYP